MSFSPDPRGYFIIKTDNKTKLITLEWYDNNHKLLKTNSCTDSDVLYSTVSVLDTFRKDHLNYLLKELKRAEHCIDIGCSYEQDEEDDLLHEDQRREA